MYAHFLSRKDHKFVALAFGPLWRPLTPAESSTLAREARWTSQRRNWKTSTRLGPHAERVVVEGSGDPVLYLCASSNSHCEALCIIWVAIKLESLVRSQLLGSVLEEESYSLLQQDHNSDNYPYPCRVQKKGPMLPWKATWMLGFKRPHEHKNPTNDDGLYIRLQNQQTGSLCVCVR